MREGTEESLEVCIQIQKIEGDLSMVSDDSDRVGRSVTMKLRTSLTDEFTVAATMVKTVLISTYPHAGEKQRWMFVISSLKEEEQKLLSRDTWVPTNGSVYELVLGDAVVRRYRLRVAWLSVR